jgi:hypothetical protein
MAMYLHPLLRAVHRLQVTINDSRVNKVIS